MNIQKIADRIANYNTDTWMVIYGDYSCVTSFKRIFDNIWVNGASGHSFGIILNDMKDDILKLGFFDGDGAARLNWIACGVDGDDVLFDQFFRKIPTNSKSKQKEIKANSVLIIKGSEDGIYCLKEVMDGVLNYSETSGSNCRVHTDDNPPVECGSFWNDEEDGNGFGFYGVFQSKTIFDNPISVIGQMGCQLKFYRS